MKLLTRERRTLMLTATATHPNLYQLQGHHLHVLYAASGIMTRQLDRRRKKAHDNYLV